MIYAVVFREGREIIRQARAYANNLVHGQGKLSPYFELMTYFMLTKTVKLMVCSVFIFVLFLVVNTFEFYGN